MARRRRLDGDSNDRRWVCTYIDPYIYALYAWAFPAAPFLSHSRHREFHLKARPGCLLPITCGVDHVAGLIQLTAECLRLTTYNLQPHGH